MVTDTVETGTVVAGAVEAGAVVAGTVVAGTVVAGAVVAGTVDAGTVVTGIDVAGTVVAGAVEQRCVYFVQLRIAHDRIVGALLVGAETGDSLVERLKKNLKIDVAMLLRGKVIASTRPAAGLTPAAGSHPEKHTKEIDDIKRTPAIPLTAGTDNLLAVAARSRVRRGRQQAPYYVLLGMQPAKSDLPSLLSLHELGRSEVGQLPVDPAAARALAVALIGVGLILQRREVEGPLEHLRKDLQQLARGEITKILDSRYGGKFGGLARDVERGDGALPAPRARGSVRDGRQGPERDPGRQARARRHVRPAQQGLGVPRQHARAGVPAAGGQEGSRHRLRLAPPPPAASFRLRCRRRRDRCSAHPGIRERRVEGLVKGTGFGAPVGKAPPAIKPAAWARLRPRSGARTHGAVRVAGRGALRRRPPETKAKNSAR